VEHDTEFAVIQLLFLINEVCRLVYYYNITTSTSTLLYSTTILFLFFHDWHSFSEIKVKVKVEHLL